MRLLGRALWVPAPRASLGPCEVGTYGLWPRRPTLTSSPRGQQLSTLGAQSCRCFILHPKFLGSWGASQKPSLAPEFSPDVPRPPAEKAAGAAPCGSGVWGLTGVPRGRALAGSSRWRLGWGGSVAGTWEGHTPAGGHKARGVAGLSPGHCPAGLREGAGGVCVGWPWGPSQGKPLVTLALAGCGARNAGSFGPVPGGAGPWRSAGGEGMATVSVRAGGGVCAWVLVLQTVPGDRLRPVCTSAHRPQGAVWSWVQVLVTVTIPAAPRGTRDGQDPPSSMFRGGQISWENPADGEDTISKSAGVPDGPLTGCGT